MPPPFLAYLGLNTDADERAVRRAYARQLKQLDPEVDPAGFQALREAYEAALDWASRRRAEAPADDEPVSAPAWSEQTATPAPPTPAPAPQAEPAPSYARLSGVPLTPVFGHDTPIPLEVTPPTFVDPLERLWPRLIAELARRPSQDEARRLLEDALADPGLTGLDDARRFERRIVALLTAGWQPGHDSLLVAAIKVFHWEAEQARLRPFDRDGTLLSAALDERAFFQAQGAEHRARLAPAFRALRNTQPPDERQLIELLPVAEKLLELYPRWAWIITGTARIEDWRRTFQAIPPRRRHKLERQAQHGAQKPKVSPGSKLAMAIFIVLTVLFGVARLRPFFISDQGGRREHTSVEIAKKLSNRPGKPLLRLGADAQPEQPNANERPEREPLR